MDIIKNHDTSDTSDYGSLVLTRQAGQSIKIIDLDGNLISVSILEVRGKQVKVNISAPKNQQIYRDEIFLKILYENDGQIPGTKYNDEFFNSCYI